MTLDELNGLGRDDFIERAGWVFEHSPWVAERAWEHRPFASLDALHGAMVREVERATPGEQLDLLRAHPDLGSCAKMSDASKGEQAGAGLDQLTLDEFARLQAFNTAYREKFGFPFLYAVKGANKHEMLGALTRRSTLEPETEFREAMLQVYRIARFRLEEMLEREDGG